MAIPFTLTPLMLTECLEISKLLGKYEGLVWPKPQPQLRRSNKIKTIQGSLAIEGNTLSIDQVTAIFENKRVLGNPREILEVKNAIKAYGEVSSYNIKNPKDLLRAHKTLMNGLIKDAGQWLKTILEKISLNEKSIFCFSAPFQLQLPAETLHGHWIKNSLSVREKKPWLDMNFIER